jgi:hypothetical protein
MASRLKAMFETSATGSPGPPPQKTPQSKGPVEPKEKPAETSSATTGKTPEPPTKEQGKSTASMKAMTSETSAKPTSTGSTKPTTSKPAKKAAPTSNNANLVIAFLKGRSSQALVQRLAMNSALQLIQGEYRMYLAKTRNKENRDKLRARRAEKLLAYQEKLSQLIARARQSGSEICMREALDRVSISKLYLNASLQMLETKEAQQRQQINKDYMNAFDNLIRSEAPTVLIPGHIENDEFTARSHIVRFYHHTWTALIESHVAVAIVWVGRQERAGRVMEMSEECRERIALIDAFRSGSWAVELRRLEAVEVTFRESLVHARTLYVVTLAQKRAQILRQSLTWEGSQSEQGERVAIISEELLELRSIWEEFLRHRVRIASATIGADESRRRLGYGGIQYQETAERNQILSAVVGLRLMYLQGDTPNDVHTECGSRTAIQWAEWRDRRTLHGLLTSVGVSLMVPVEEGHRRQQILREEFAARGALRGRPENLDILVSVTEPINRKGIFLDHMQSMFRSLLTYGALKVQGKEESRRNMLLRLFSVEYHHLISLEYLLFVEMKERRLLVGSLQRLLQKANAFSGLKKRELLHFDPIGSPARNPL